MTFGRGGGGGGGGGGGQVEYLQVIIDHSAPGPWMLCRRLSVPNQSLHAGESACECFN